MPMKGVATQMRERLQDTFSTLDWSQPKKRISRSGPGSTLAHTQSIREALPKLFAKYGVKTFLDAPCGDWNWMQYVDLKGVDYVGIDIVEDIVKTNTELFSGNNIRFQVADVTSDVLPKSDLLMCRDCLFHLKHWLKWEFFKNFHKSGIQYLLTSVHNNPVNRKLPSNGKFRWFNPRIEPFNLCDPIELILDSPFESERQTEDDFRSIRYMGLWNRDQVANALKQNGHL